MRLMERDFLIFKELDRWRFLLSRHIVAFCGFTGERACYRRLKVLLDSGYVDRQYLFYGFPALYTLTHKGKALTGANTHREKIRIEQVSHDVMVLDTVLYLMRHYNLPLSAFTSEKQLHQLDGFSNRMHRPDFLFEQDGKTICVEVELSQKSKSRFLKNLKDNFTRYDRQVWVLPAHEQRNKTLIQKSGFTDIEVTESEVIERERKRKG